MEESGTTDAPVAEAEAGKKPVRFGGMTASEAGRKGAEARKRTLAKRAESAAHVNATPRDLTRSPLDALRDLMHADPDAYAEGLSKLVKAGDPRSITIMRDLFATKGSVAIPRAEATVRAMSAEDRRALLLELEARGATLPDEAMSDDARVHAREPDQHEEA